MSSTPAPKPVTPCTNPASKAGSSTAANVIMRNLFPEKAPRKESCGVLLYVIYPSTVSTGSMAAAGPVFRVLTAW